ncbi:MAG: flavodoxin family protein [Peptostreptococcaceae bacterium]|nr:flavodoxin family protein [Peptostreptococcaceae bacterium]
MKKVFAFIGSSMGKQSGTALFARRILEKAEKKYEGELEFEIITADQVNIKPCKGCCNCFRYCECPQDKNDDMEMIKKKMIGADFVIWGSPVYAHQISGQMKILIDRISYWLHLLRLAGKPGIVLTTTSGTGYMEVLSYLSKIMFHMGVKAVGGYSAFANFQGSFIDNDDVDRKAEKAAVVICNYLSGKKPLVSNATMEATFKVLKQSIIQTKKEKPGEYEFWEKEGYFECNSFNELLEKKQRRSR